MKNIILKAKKEVSVKRRHPWVFSGAIAKKEEKIEDGERVVVLSKGGERLGVGHYQDGSIMVRLFAFGSTEIDSLFWKKKLKEAFQLRQSLGLPQSGSTDCFRLVHGEGDGLPGLIIDLYGSTAVLQCHSIGMYKEREKLAAALKSCLGDRITAVYDKSASSLPSAFGASVTDDYLLGSPGEGMVRENDFRFFIDWETGQKTGFFLDQRENRALVGRYCKDKRVLNAFCYSGGFSVYALGAGAQAVDSVDISQKAIDLTEKNIALNPAEGAHSAHCADVLSYLKESNDKYDVMIVDPPAFAKTLAKRHKAVQGYKRLNALALKKVAPNGMLFTFSCSQVVDDRLFYNTIVAAAIEAGREVSVMYRLSQPADHPVSLFHPEGSYLKGLALWVK
jgi:23S rRNA (cytosine1962-C5)-methyltransferase